MAFIIQENKSLKGYNTFGIDAKAARFVELSCCEDYESLVGAKMLRKDSFFVLGGGSNVVFMDDYDGVIVHPENKGIRMIEAHDGFYEIEAEAGEVWDSFVGHCIDNGWYGLETMAGIPGCVGAAPVQNVGAYGNEAKDFVTKVHYYDVTTGEDHWIDNGECRFEYRNSVFKGDLRGRCLIDRVRFRLHDTFVPNLTYKALTEALSRQGLTNPTAREVAETVRRVRDSKLPNPKQIGSAGSFFKNPVVSAAEYERLAEAFPGIVAHAVGNGFKLAAGWMIENCGWKGCDRGNVGVYEKQALVLVNRGGCSGREVRELADEIIADVEARFGVRLECEAIFI
ncbi:MAG: UDP-N-acetylmuramate dehydrogenase [Bacteroidales bacterium]|nr:UDP-N-acetylmuramate dehydrogenase [Bacteroidales bacterium]